MYLREIKEERVCIRDTIENYIGAKKTIPAGICRSFAKSVYLCSLESAFTLSLHHAFFDRYYNYLDNYIVRCIINILYIHTYVYAF